jgi:hypothetical protein
MTVQRYAVERVIPVDDPPYYLLWAWGGFQRWVRLARFDPGVRWATVEALATAHGWEIMPDAVLTP